MQRIKSDLTPPLGWPGGPCHLIDRIVGQVADPRQEQQLIEEVISNQDLSVSDTAKIYDLEVEPGAGGAFKQILIGRHAQYRMDWRGITVHQVRAALKYFFKLYGDAKSRRDALYTQWSRAIERDEPINWTDNRLGLTLAFYLYAKTGQVKLVTVYWVNASPPKYTPGECDLPQRKASGYRNPESLSGWITFTPNSDGTKPSGGDKQQVLPSPPNTRSKPQGRPSLNTPPASDEALDDRPLHKDRVRTLGVPGEDTLDYTSVVPRTTPIRRQNLASLCLMAAMKGPSFPGRLRQKEERGQAKRYFRKYYSQNRTKIRQRMKRWFKRNKRKPELKRDRKRRELYPERFTRFPGGAASIAERGQEQRKEQKRIKQASSIKLQIPVFYLPYQAPAILVGLDLNTERATLVYQDELKNSISVKLPLQELFTSIVFDKETDLDFVFETLDSVWGVNPTGESETEEEFLDAEEQLLDEWYFGGGTAKIAWVLERIAPDVPADQKTDRATNVPRGEHEHEPLEGFEPNDQQLVWENPGSAKVMPWNSDLVNNKAAARLADIQNGCDEKLLSKVEGIVPQLIRVDTSRLLWLFNVPGSKGDSYRVRIKAKPKGKTIALSKMDIVVSCSCPYWRWQGPEHWAKVEGYLYGKPRGTASLPWIKDPEATHRACKHVLAVFDKMKNYALIRPHVKKGSNQGAIRIAQRYLKSMWD